METRQGYQRVSIHALLLSLLLAAPQVAWAESVLALAMRSDQIQGTAVLGTVNVPALGNITLVAQRTGTRVVIHATDTAGHVVGRAETVGGLRETPLHVRTPAGLYKVTLHWGKPAT